MKFAEFPRIFQLISCRTTVFVGSFSLRAHHSVLLASHWVLGPDSSMCVHSRGAKHPPQQPTWKVIRPHDFLLYCCFQNRQMFHTKVAIKLLLTCLLAFSISPNNLPSQWPRRSSVKVHVTPMSESSQGLPMAVGQRPSSLPWPTGWHFMTWLLHTARVASFTVFVSRRLTVFSSKKLNRFPCPFTSLSLC